MHSRTGHGPDPDTRQSSVLETPRLRLEVPEVEDAAELFRLVGGADREAICATLIWDGPDHLDDMVSWIRRCREEPFAVHGLHWLIRDRTGAITGCTGRPMGSICTRPFGVAGRGDVGYWLGKAYWRRGIMTEALAVVLDHCFDTLDYTRIDAQVFATNVPGRRLVERAGMTYEGLARAACCKKGCWCDEAIYGILATDPRPGRRQ